MERTTLCTQTEARRVLVVANPLLDIYLPSNLTQEDTLTQLSARISEPGEGDPIALSGYGYAGGSGFTTALAAESQGCEVWYTGAVGEDAPGRFLAESAKTSGLKTCLLIKKASTGSCIYTFHRDHTLQARGLPGAAALYTEIDFEGIVKQIANPSLIYIDGFFLAATGISLLTVARKFPGCPIALDIAAGPVSRRLAPALEALSREERQLIIFGTEHEFRSMENLDQEVFLKPGWQLPLFGSKTLVIVKLGKEGAYCYQNTALWHEPAFLTQLDIPEEQLVGAGDAFAGGFIAGYLQSLQPHSCLELASKAAAHCISHIGSYLSLPY